MAVSQKSARMEILTTGSKDSEKQSDFISSQILDAFVLLLCSPSQMNKEILRYAKYGDMQCYIFIGAKMFLQPLFTCVHIRSSVSYLSLLCLFLAACLF